MDIHTALDKATSINRLASILGVTRQAVQHWKRKGLPQAQIDELRRRRPEWFAQLKREAEAAKARDERATA